ncbi:hypothetical protein [Ramlibacter alkalitolerans]|uniref:DUF4124 domain-containing protein n=1 Tax=Ramlibacter alkalitolerans TaxID=2039631 RepID=A0ABS1JNH6_9BURK|nr:hypothetical protein [Ramlibacter alkalitolerans]MBL0425778.1 hypothetical protein [Ramlibacter alkalitolerans]
MTKVLAILLAGVCVAGTAMARERHVHHGDRLIACPPGLVQLREACVPPGQLRRHEHRHDLNARDTRARHELALRDARIRHDAALRAAELRHQDQLRQAEVRHQALLDAARRRHDRQLASRH